MCASPEDSGCDGLCIFLWGALRHVHVIVQFILSELFYISLLPPTYVVRGKVIFILGNVCLFTIGWGGYPIPDLGGGYPIPGLDDGGVPPCQVWMVGGTQGTMTGWGTPTMTGWGTPPTIMTAWGTPQPSWLDGVPSPPHHHDWMGYPPFPTSIASTCYRRVVCLLRSRRRTFLCWASF